MYVSTAYANCAYEKIEEKFYEAPYNYEGVVSLVGSANDDKKLEKITPRYLNYYFLVFYFYMSV